MRKIKLNTFAIFLSTIFCLLLMVACGSTDSVPDDAAVTATITIGSDEPFYFILDMEEGMEGIRLHHFAGDEDNPESYELTTNWMITDPLVHIIHLAVTVPGMGSYNMMKKDDDFGVFLMTYSYDLKTFDADNVTVTIKELSENQVKGTFEGTFYSDEGEKVIIEDGKFNVTPR